MMFLFDSSKCVYFYSGVLLTIVLLMRCVDPVKHRDGIRDSLQKLTVVDPMRKNYYHDLRKLRFFLLTCQPLYVWSFILFRKFEEGTYFSLFLILSWIMCLLMLLFHQ